MGMLNSTLALLSNVNHKNNLVRCFAMKRKINQKYLHLCSGRVPMTRFLFGDVSQMAKHTEESEKLMHKITAKEPLAMWRYARRSTRGFWGKVSHKGFSLDFSLMDCTSQFPVYRLVSTLTLHVKTLTQKTTGAGDTTDPGKNKGK